LVIISIAIITAVVWWFIDPSKIVYTFASVLIVACPCALALALPFSFGSALRHYGRNGLYLKKADVIESLNKIDTIVFDKTGTITYTDTMHVEFDGKELSAEQKFLAKSLSRQSFHPLSKSIFEFLDADYTKEVDDFREIPASGIIGNIDNKEVRLGSAKFVKIENSNSKELSSIVHFMIDGEYFGYFTIRNRYRNGLNKIVKKLQKKYDLYVISGDNESEKETLSNIFGCDNCLEFNQSPVEKLNFIKDLKSKGKKVLMIGDGLNDAGALNESDVGISIADDVFNFSPACDAILEADSFKKLPDFIKLTNRSLKIVYASFAISFLYNVVGLSFAVSANLSPVIAAVIMPISSVSVVAFTTLASQIALKKLYKS
jgi:Cu+-exporting ATPase